MYKEDILRILKNTNDYVSGEDISRKLGISRMAVSKNISNLKDIGYEIDSRTNKGYKLLSYQPRYDYTEIYSSLPSDMALLFFEELPSTNTYLKTIASLEEYSGKTICVVAKTQSAGRGRRGHGFVSKNGIYASILIRPRVKYEDLACLTAFAGVCICEVISDICGVQAQIKWVNDILLNGKKICGILTEISMEAETAYSDYAIIGFGINTDMQIFPEELSSIAGSIEEITAKKVDKSLLLNKILMRIVSLERDLTLKRELYLKKYKELCLTIGKQVKVLSDPEYTANAVDIADDCSLMVKLDSGEIRLISFGEVSVRGLLGYGN